MRNLLKTGLTCLALLVAIPSIANAQASFLLGMVVGMGLSSDGTSVSGADAPSNIMYLMPRAAERIKDPLALQVAASDCDQYGQKNIRQRFNATVYDPDQKEIVQVVRTSGASNTSCLVLWFVFTDKDNIRSINTLPALSQK